MKKTVSIVLAFLMLIRSVPLSLASDSLSVSFDYYEKSTEKKVIIKSSADTNALDLHIAAYKENRLVSFKKIDMALSKGIVAYETGINWDEVEKDKVKMFLWDENCRPHANYEYEVLRPVSSKLSVFEVTEAALPIDYNGSTAYRLSGTYKGMDTRIIVYNPKGYTDKNPEDFQKGDLALISEPDGDGVVSYIEELKGEKIEGVVSDTPITEVAASGIYDPETIQKCKIGEKLLQAGSFNMDRYLGKKVTVYAENETIIYIEESALNTSVSITANQLVGPGEKNYDTAGVVAYREASSAKTTSLDIDVNADIFVDYVKNTSLRGMNATTADITSMIPCGGRIEFISNDGDSDIEYIIVTRYNREAVVSEIELIDSCYYFDCYFGALPDIDVADTDTEIIIYKDGVPATVTDLAANDTISSVKVAKDFYIFYASSVTVEGTVEAYDTVDNLVTIEGTDYLLSAHFPRTVASLSGEKGTFFLNVDGEIAHFEQDPAIKRGYALITALYQETKVGASVDFIQAVLADGTVAEYELDVQAKLQDYAGNTLNASLKTALQAALSYNDATTYRATVSDITGYNANTLLVRLSLNDNGKVTKARTLEGVPGVASSDRYDELSSSIGVIEFKEDAIIFSVKSPIYPQNHIDADDVKVGTLTTFFTDDEAYTLRAYDEDGDSVYGVGIGMDLTKFLAIDSSVLVVTSKKTITYNGENAYVVTGMQNGDEKNITIYNEDNADIMSAAGALAEGDVILISDPDEDGITSDFQKLIDINKGTPQF